ncbi:MAG: MYG1 family protein [Nanoarchaeota archaeon]|nr:MYG1 family protein [Nanoarchaeota archaeon]
MKKTVVATHDGKFHADEVFAIAILKKVYPSLKIIRTKESELLKKSDINVDIGRKYNPKKGYFDHHQSDFKLKRKNGIPYASAGIVWSYYGSKILNSKESLNYVDEKLIQFIDANDSGVKTYDSKIGNVYHISNLIDSFNPGWTEKVRHDSQFKKALSVAQLVLEREIVRAKSYQMSSKIVKDALKKLKGKNYIVINSKNVMWRDFVIGNPKINFVIHPSIDRWSSNSVPKKVDSFQRDVLFPDKWGGLEGKSFEKVSGVKGALFCHKDGFIVSAKTKDGAIKLTEIALGKKEK